MVRHWATRISGIFTMIKSKHRDDTLTLSYFHHDGKACVCVAHIVIGPIKTCMYTHIHTLVSHAEERSVYNNNNNNILCPGKKVCLINFDQQERNVFAKVLMKQLY